MKFNYENLHRKSPKPLWFRTFLRRYLNRFAMLVASVRFEPTASGLSLRAGRRRVSFCSQGTALLQNSHFGRHRLQKQSTGLFLLH